MRSLIASLFFGSVVLSACASPVAEDGDAIAATEADELRVLTPGEIVGTIGYGQTKNVVYTPTPRYRALSFQAAAGDQVEIWVRGQASADARAFLLNAEYQTVGSNDDASPGVRDAKIATTIKSTGTHYIALREMDEESSPVSKFDVSLAKTNEPPPPPPPPPPTADPFDPASCAGPALAHASIVAMFPAGTLGTKKFSGTVSARVRTCTELGGCSAWQDTTEMYAHHRWYGCERDRKRCATDQVNLLVQFENSIATPFQVGLEMKTSDFPDLADSFSLAYDGGGRVVLGDLWNGGKGLNMETMLAGRSMLGAPFELDVREGCFRAVMKRSTGGGSAQLRTDGELVVLGKITH